MGGGEIPDDIWSHNFIYLFINIDLKVNKLVILNIKYIVGSFNK